MTPSESSKIIRGLLCRGLSPEQAEQILKAMVPVTAETGLVVFKEGERPQGLMVLVEGTVEVFKDGSREVLATIAAPTPSSPSPVYPKISRSKFGRSLRDLLPWPRTTTP